MLTIMHRKADGSELLFEAESVARAQPEGEQCVPARGKFIAYGCPHPLPGGERHFEIEEPFGAVFVMNKTGATVARYTI